jgi:hypothetical protein
VQPVDQYKALVPIVRRILLERWDPIGVNDVPEAQNEYDSYVPGVIALLINGSSAAEIAAHLGHVRHGRMELGWGSEHELKVARALLAAFATLDGDQA